MKKSFLNFLCCLAFLSAGLNGDVQIEANSAITSAWDTGYVTELTVTNSSNEAISSWKVNFSLPQGQSVHCLWNGAFTQSNQNVTVTSQTENTTIQAGQSAKFGFQVENPQMATGNLQGVTATGVPVVPSLPNATLGAVATVDTVWATAYEVKVTLTNNSNTPVSSWIATFTMPEGHSLSSHVWNGVFTLSGQNVTVKSLTSSEVIPPGGSSVFTMIIVMPSLGKPRISNLQAAANGSAPLQTAPRAPVLNPIMAGPTPTVSWNAVDGATSYTLEQGTTSSFSNPVIVAKGNVLSAAVSAQAAGTYFYRVSATNDAGTGAYSNVQSVSTSQAPSPPPPPPVPPLSQGIEHSAWYIDWTSWFTGPPFVIPTNVNRLNIFVGELKFDGAGKPTLGGFGNLTDAQIDAFTAYCRSQNPPIEVKVSIGGSGGMYDRCWDRLTTANTQAFAQGMADFCHAHGLVGVDFDYEEFLSSDQEVLVGTLIKQFKAIDPNFKTSLCSNAGFGPYYPWQPVVKTILDAAMISPGNCAVDMFYIMSYYDPIESEKGWILGWSNWLKQNYGFTSERVSVGIDDFDAHAYDPVEMANWAASQGFSTSHWAFDPAHPK